MDAEELVDLAVAGEEWVTVSDLAHDAPDGPDVNFLSVVVRQEQLWGPVPPRRYVISQSLSCFVVEDASEAKVTDAEVVLLPETESKMKVRN